MNNHILIYKIGNREERRFRFSTTIGYNETSVSIVGAV